ncbi:5-oxoprolinase subunit PxpA [Salegentibacter sp. JZCK2]|uniref:5-oxoprolinase subunit PxpA n=1 Tax=Salegentibacter tibetensis TaxID=2873600 RepID=UPI001CCFA7B6|nr:5-oxoprolinase subunit PxpA [Salegentibacter tibetensis]MBZ9731533.1 5-oxoprolinase subunit PxpA [Salegentibacter tibetensis]
MKEIHINCDLGEGGDFDADLMPHISACNIACGGHAGNLETMQETIKLAVEHGVQMGAHPSYPDKENFGRKPVDISAEELQRSIIAQILSLKQLAEAEGVKLTHVKPHGALYNKAAKDEKTAKIIIDSLLEFDQELTLFCPPKSVISKLAKGKTPIVFEAFADRNYEPDLSLVSRSKPNALITEKEAVFRHLFSMFSEGKITCVNAEKINYKADTFCLHSDTPNSVEIITFLKQRFAEHNIKIKNRK